MRALTALRMGVRSITRTQTPVTPHRAASASASAGGGGGGGSGGGATSAPTKSQSQNLAAIRDEFSQQADWFEADWGARSKTSNADIMQWAVGSITAAIERAGVGASGGVASTFLQEARALDVACGTGVMTRALAPLTKSVTGLDATQGMLERARAVEAEAEHGSASTGREGARPEYICGDAIALPFADGEFNLVTSRLAVHHFPDPLLIVQEMARVCAPGGFVVLVDLVSDEDPVAAAEHNRLEILRDPTHTRALTATELGNLLTSAGCLGAELEIVPPAVDSSSSDGALHNVMDLDGWMQATNTPDEAQRDIVRSFDNELGGGPSTGMAAHRDADGQYCFVHRYVTVVARRVGPE
eukprot:m.97567 g.97567  ORF g.97567 m.97567 type:complete len:357 (-) comp20541_c0_seq1:166-1236(-)